MVSTDRITEFFCSIDDFCKVSEPALKQITLTQGSNKRNRSFKMSSSEILTITVMFHLSSHRIFKHFSLYYVQKHIQKEFPDTVSYNRYVELMQGNMLPLTLDMKTCCLGSASASHLQIPHPCGFLRTTG